MRLGSSTAHDDEIELGNIKILQLGQQESRPQIPNRFKVLDSDFCSVGQSIEYYEKLMSLPSELRVRYLIALQDAVFDAKIEGRFKNEKGWETSLFRFGEALNTLRAGRKLLTGNALDPERMSFQFEWRKNNYTSYIPFDFDDAEELPGRCNILIGYNGVGKTTLLADLALAAARGAKKTLTKSEILGADTTFGAVLAISYSAFDTFTTPDNIRGTNNAANSDPSRIDAFGYVYCGLRRQTGFSELNQKFALKSIDEIEDEFVEALNSIGRLDTREHLVSAFEALTREPSFGQAGVDLGRLGAETTRDDAIAAFQQLSTGHKIVLNIVTQLATHLRSRSLVLIDEPETHLHPPLVAALLRAIQVLLNASSSFAVIATHSPVVVQEIPSQFVRILERDGEGPVTLRDSEIETFAENIGAITRHVFSLDNSATDYQSVLRDLSRRYNIDEIDEMFEAGLSVQGRALVANYRHLQ